MNLGRVPCRNNRGRRRDRWGMTLLALVWLAIWPSESVWALNPNRALTQAFLRKWQVTQGLPQATIQSIRQTSDGYLCLGTQSGLYHFDGLRFVAAPISHGPVLDNCWIQDLCEDRDGALWIATRDAGLFRLKGAVSEAFSTPGGLPSKQIRCLALDGQGNLWIGTNDGLVRRTGTALQTFTSTQGLPNNDVRALCVARDGTVWIGCGGGSLAYWNTEGFGVRELRSIPGGTTTLSLLSAADGSVWVGTSAGLIRLQGDKEERFTREQGLANNSVECLLQSSDGAIWAGTRDGICRIQGAEFENFRSRDGLSQSTVFALCEDHEGSIWVGAKHGLNQFVDRRTLPLTASEGLPSNETGPIIQDHKGTVWIGTLGEGLATSDGRHCRRAADVQKGLPSNVILSLVDGDDGDLWVGSDKGVCRVQEGQASQRYGREEGLPDETVHCLCRDPEGVLWAGTSAGLVYLHDGRFVSPEGDPEILKQPILSLLADHQEGVLFSAGAGRVYRCADGRIAPWSAAGNELHDVDALHRDQQGLLWLGTQGAGLWLAEPGRMQQFTVQDGLYDDEIFGIISDDVDRLWCACSRGIFYIHRADLLKFAAGTIDKFRSFPFSPTDALRTVECQRGVQPGIWKMQDGRLWFSTIYGVIVADPTYVRRSLPPPPVQIEDIQVNGRSIPAGEPPEETRGYANLSIRYTALSFVAPTRTAFRYQLEGFDEGWIEAGDRREAFYTNIPPGKYRFRVAAAALEGPWTEAIYPVEFLSRPYFYQTSWFWGLLAASAGAAAFGVFRLRVLQMKAKMHAVVAERTRIARELHDTLIQGFSGVTMQMQAVATRLPPSSERKTLQEVIRDAGQCLREARRSVGGLRNTPGQAPDLTAAIRQVAKQLTEMRDIRVTLNLEPCGTKIPVDVEYNLLRIVQEAIANAVKHAAARHIEVVMDSTPEELHIRIRDDGVGFHLNQQPQPGHYGLVGMQERARQVHSQLQMESNPGGGTAISIRLPLEPDQEPAPKPSPPIPEPAAEEAARS